MRIAFRVDGTPQIGTGHVMRCLSLAAALREAGAGVRFVCRGADRALAGRIDAAGVGLIELGAAARSAVSDPAGPVHATWAEAGWDQDAADTVAALAANPPDWLVVDHYALDARWHRHVAEELGCRIAVIDDLADRPLAADLVIDHNAAADHQAKYRPVLQAPAPVLGGPRFALLGPAFAAAPRHQPRTDVGSIGVFMGGTDPGAASARALRAVRAGGFAGPVEVVSTSSNPHLEQLRTAVDADADATLSLDLPDLAAFFARHDLQIGAGGGATWERLCIGAPTILVGLADNQHVVLEALAERGVASLLPGPDWEARLPAAVAEMRASPALRAEISARAQTLVDGKGCRRVACALLRQAIAVRPATLADGAMLHRWRNAPATRAVSRDPREIALSAHMAWLDAALINPARRLLVGMAGTVPVGSVRFDRLDDERWEVSIYLDPELAGLGLGGPLLASAERALSAQLPHPVTLIAETLPGNAKSQTLFLRGGYIGKGPFTKCLQPHTGPGTIQ